MKIHNPLVITGAIDTQASRIPATRSIGPEIKNLYPMKLAERIYPWGQGFNLKSQI
ncbi:hypothetical protein QUB47_24855 [Microcoleus sp. AT9_B5]